MSINFINYLIINYLSHFKGKNTPVLLNFLVTFDFNYYRNLFFIRLLNSIREYCTIRTLCLG